MQPGVIPEPPPSANVNTNIRMSICMCVLCSVTLILPAVFFAFIGLLCSLCVSFVLQKCSFSLYDNLY